MDRGTTAPDPNYRIHIHNLSLFALRSYILEVKKYPIIYNGNTRMENVLGEYSSALIDLAWDKIVAALLDTSVNFELAQRKGYWVRSFRELWKWVRSVLKKDMISRRSKSIHIRNPNLNWVEYLRFLEPYTQLSENSSTDGNIDLQLDPDIQIQIQPPGAMFITEGNNPTVIWLRDSSEHADDPIVHVSICIRVPAEAAIDFGGNPSGYDNSLQLSETGNAQISTQNELEYAVLPLQPGSVSTLIDEDFQFIMSIRPMVQQLEPRRRAEVKVQMIEAVYKVLFS